MNGGAARSPFVNAGYGRTGSEMTGPTIRRSIARFAPGLNKYVAAGVRVQCNEMQFDARP